jgi:hypothetical protein
MDAAPDPFCPEGLGQQPPPFTDLCRLQRDVLPNDITSREEAEILLVIDQTLERADETSPRSSFSSCRAWRHPYGPA